MMEENGDVVIVGGSDDMNTGKVNFLD